MASIYYLNNPPFCPFDSSAIGLENHPCNMFGGHHGHHGPGPRHHGAPRFHPSEHRPRGRHCRGRGRGRDHRPDEGHNSPQQTEEDENSRTAEQHADSTPSTDTLTPETQGRQVGTQSGIDSENEHRHGRKDKHKHRKFHGAGKFGRCGKDWKGCHGNEVGPKGKTGKFDGCAHGGHNAFGNPHTHPHHVFGHRESFRARGHRRGRHGRGMWHGDFLGPEFHGPMWSHHNAMRQHHKAFRHHHMAQHDPMRQMRWHFGPHFQATQRDVDFVPFVDIFDTTSQYLVHVSLPGAKKSDLSLEYDAENSALRLSGIVNRPHMNEKLYEALAMDERSGEIGVFERVVRLGTPQAPAPVLADGIIATLEEGVLMVTIPKIEESQTNKNIIPVECETCGEENIDDTSSEMDDSVLDGEARENVATPASGGTESEEEEHEGYVKISVQ